MVDLRRCTPSHCLLITSRMSLSGLLPGRADNFNWQASFVSVGPRHEVWSPPVQRGCQPWNSLHPLLQGGLSTVASNRNLATRNRGSVVPIQNPTHPASACKIPPITIGFTMPVGESHLCHPRRKAFGFSSRSSSECSGRFARSLRQSSQHATRSPCAVRHDPADLVWAEPVISTVLF